MKSKEASHVYLLMQDEYRISRNARASWYFSHLNEEIAPDQIDSDSEGIKVLSVVPEVNHQSTEEEEDGEIGSDLDKGVCIITPTTTISFLAKKYRYVFVLDLSPSVAAVDIHSENVLLDELYKCLCTVIRSLLNPFQVPGCEIILQPEIYITVVAHTPFINCRVNQVLVQGCQITLQNVNQVLQQLASKLEELENEVVKCMHYIVCADQDDTSDESQKLNTSQDDTEDARDSPEHHLMTPEASFISMLRYGLLALHLFQENSTAGIIVLTDGVVGSPDAALFESLMVQLRHNSISCSFLQVGQWCQTPTGLGQVPYNELMQFMATATFGSYFTKIKDLVDPPNLEMNAYQVALLTWSFQRALTGLKVEGSQIDTYEQLNENLAWTHRIQSFGEDRHLWATPLMKKTHTERNLHTAISHLISCRLREGYTIKQVSIFKGNSQIEVQLVLPWRDKVWIHYVAVSAWPLDAGRRITHVDVTVEGSYDFLHDATCPQKKPFKSHYREAMVRKYWQTLQSMLESDQLLMHLQSFSSNRNYYEVPESVQKGVPLFYMPPHTSSPQVNIQLNSKDPLVAQFTSFWRPVLVLDVNVWQKWMHTHRIGLVLEHDKPVGKHLHTPNLSDRFQVVTCRQAQTALNAFLAEQCTFVLMENHSYIRLIFDDPEKPPTSFYVLRVAHKPPCLVLRLAFLGGTSGQLRYKIVEELTEGIKQLLFPRRGTAKSEKAKKDSPVMDMVSPSSGHCPPLQRALCETPCCHAMTKPIEKILMRYERVPYDFLATDLPPQLDPSAGLPLTVSTVNSMGSSVFMTLSRYLYHRRWVWCVQHAGSLPMSMQAVGRILSNLTKMRLQEGFQFANASSGIINLIAEMNMMDDMDENGCADFAESDHVTCAPSCGSNVNPCVIQYLIFPLHTATVTDSLRMSEDDLEESDAPEADQEQQIITEIWVEPQYGNVIDSPPERKHFDGKDYKQLALATLPYDLECISTMVTFEYLNLMCTNRNVPSPSFSSSIPVHPSPTLQPAEARPDTLLDSDAVIQRMPFSFDLIKVLSKCQQAELLFSTLIQDDTKPAKSENEQGPAEDQAAPTEKTAPTKKEPNDLLLKFFLERLEEAHNREVHLQDEECELLREIVLKRSRSADDGAAPLRPSPASSAEWTRPAAAAAAAAAACGGSSPWDPASREGSPWRAKAPPVVSTPGEAAANAGGSQSIARWRCFIRSVNTTHLILCFVPATLEDLRLIMQSGPGEATDGNITQDEHTLVDQSDVDGGDEQQDTEPAVGACSVDGPPADLAAGEGPADEAEGKVEPDEVGEQSVEPPSAESGVRYDQTSEYDSETKNEETWRSTGPSSLTIPVYVYNCPLSGLTDQLVNRWTYQRPPDIVQDKTRSYVGVSTGCGTETDRQRIDSETIRDKIRQSMDERHESVHGSQVDFRNHLALLKEHYQRSLVIAVYESLLAGHNVHAQDMDAVINGICEESLPIEMNITRYLHLACTHIDRMLERAKLEQMMREDTAKMIPGTVKVGEEEVAMASMTAAMVGETEEAGGDSSADGGNSLEEHGTPVVLPGSLEHGEDEDSLSEKTDSLKQADGLGQMPLLLSLSKLESGGTCDEQSSALHDLIQRKFDRIISHNFKAVPSNPDFFYYCPPDYPSKSSTSVLDTTGGQFNTSAASDSREATSCSPSTKTPRRLTKFSGKPVCYQRQPMVSKDPDADAYSEDVEVFASDVDSRVVRRYDDSGDSDVCYSESDGLDSAREDVIDGDGGNGRLGDVHANDDYNEDVDNEDCVSNLSDLRNLVASNCRAPPLFIHLICSVRTEGRGQHDWDGRALRSMAVRKLPTCLGDLRTCLDSTGTIDLNGLQVTLDIICLTLPTEIDSSEFTEYSSFNRMMSYNSQISHMSSSSAHEREDAASVRLTKEVYDSLRSLSDEQRNAVSLCKDEVLWLLNDEIASALRRTMPVTAETLEMVASHVRSSKNKPCCITKSVPLQFVYGPEQSLTHFIQNFERIELRGYLLNKESSYYYLLDHARANNHAHWKAVSSALHDLYTDSKPFKSDAVTGSTLCGSTSEAGLTQAGNQVVGGGGPDGGREPVAPSSAATKEAGTSKENSSEEKGRDGTTEENQASFYITASENEGADFGSRGTESRESSHDSDKGPTRDVSDPETDRKPGYRSRNSSGEQASYPPAEDIRISVIRPSPMKEAQPKMIDEEAPAPASSQRMQQAGSDSSTPRTSHTADGGTRTLQFVGLEDTPGSSPVPSASKDTAAGDTPLLTSVPSQDQAQAAGRRSLSNVSLDKYRTSNLTPSNPQTPNRSRHQSGLQTPLSGSIYDAASQGSVGEEGYDGGSSDAGDDDYIGMAAGAHDEEEEEEVHRSFSESMLRCRPLPDFWLIMEIRDSCVEVYFHTRDTDEQHSNVREHQELFEYVIRTIAKMCRTVNQWLLLQDLNKTRQCNQLLVPEADDDVQWPAPEPIPPKDSKTRFLSTVAGDSDDSDSGGTTQERYLAASLQLRPGYFACERVWKKDFNLHPRLQQVPRRFGICEGLRVLKSALDTFAVVNRKNMFVICEQPTGAVFYLRLEQTRPAQRQNTSQFGSESSPGFRYDEDLFLSTESMHPMVSRSPSMLSLPQKLRQPEPEDDQSRIRSRMSQSDLLTQQRSLGDGATGEEDSLSMSQTLRSSQGTPEECITLSAYGIGNVGPYISQKLVNLLQKRLDDSLLGNLVVLYARNPMFKLMPQDVKFLQPECSKPKQIQLCVPPSALLQQHALSYYLYQNLLQFLHTPKYADPSPDKAFRNYSQPDMPPFPDNQVFIYSTRPQHAGGMGIACIHQTFVDGKGSPIQLIGSPKPPANAYKDALDPSLFESMVSPQIYIAQPGKGPGSTSLVQFSIWERGEMDSKLGERLQQAMKHAICDIIMEYRLLTAPLCDVPPHYSSGIDSPMHSAPQSPVTHFTGPEQKTFSGDGVKKNSDGGRTPKEKTLFNIFKSKSISKESPKENTGGSPALHVIEGHRRREAEIRQKVLKYEAGERGVLEPSFSSTLIEWFEFCAGMDPAAPSVQHLKLNLNSRYPVDYVLREIQSSLASLVPDVTCRVFKYADSSSSSVLREAGLSTGYLPHLTSRSQQAQEKSESWMGDLPAFSQPLLPGKATSYIIVGRNLQRWRASIDCCDPDDETVADTGQTSTVRSQKKYQKFLALETSARQSVDKSSESTVPSPLPDKCFVPRQCLMLTTINDKQIKVYTYNWSSDVQNNLENQITKTVAWHNARSMLLACILGSKAGLSNMTYDAAFTRYLNAKENIHLVNGELQSLVKYTSPPAMQPQSRGGPSSSQRARTGHGGLGQLREIYRDNKPSIPMQRSSRASMRDPLHRHGAQMFDLKWAHKKEEDKKTVLMQLYENWQQRMGPSHAPIAETDLELLKTSSRMIHSVATPLLLSPLWRQKVLQKRPNSRHDSRASDTAKPRSRHSSGASNRSRRSDSMDSKKRVDSPDVTGLAAAASQAFSSRIQPEEAWHIDLRHSFINQYIQYLTSLGFVQIRTRNDSPKRSSRHLSGDFQPAKVAPPPAESSKQVIKPNYTYLQKTLPGGIMLLEIGFRDVFFCVHVYAFECSRLPIRSINPQVSDESLARSPDITSPRPLETCLQLAVIFTDECEKFKDLTHAHSFAHDFHLRTIQSHITGRHQVFRQNYNLAGVLQDFIQYYPHAPSFSRNYVLAGVSELPLSTNDASGQLFLYMLEHAQLYGMRALRMVLSEDDQDVDSEDALVMQFSGLPEEDAQMLKAKPDDYDVGLVITHDSLGGRSGGCPGLDGDRPMLRLKYYVLLTSRNELFPKPTLEKRLGMFKSTLARQYPAGVPHIETAISKEGKRPEEGTPEPPGGEQARGTWVPATHHEEQTPEGVSATARPTAQYVEAYQDNTDYLGYTNKYQAIIYKILMRQAEEARSKIKEMVGSAMAQCRRDLLWQRMLLPGSVTEEEGRRKRRSEHDEGKEPYLTRLSFIEFQELLNIVTRVRLSKIDSQLTVMENMSRPWYLALVRVLRSQYGDSHRYFVSPDGHVQYVVVLNPNFLDTFMMLAVDCNGNKTELSAVYRERMTDQSHTPTNPNLPAHAVQMLIEGFVNTCFYHMWTGLL